MRLRSFLIPALLPLSAFAQDSTPAAAPVPAASTEFAFNVGHALDNAFLSFETGGYLRGSVSLLKSRGHFQYGFTVEGGTNSNDQWYFAPGIVANYRGIGRQGYWYTGGMAGYNASGEMMPMRPAGVRQRNYYNGYVFGIQAGRVQQLSRRFSLTAEAAVRSSQNWIQYIPDQTFRPYYGPYEQTQVVVYIPVTIGFRYTL